MLFKIAAVPFHQWAPDAYEGAPTSITGFMSVSVKAAGWAMLLRVFLFGLYPLRTLYVPLLIFVAVATMTGGNLAAITQTNRSVCWPTPRSRTSATCCSAWSPAMVARNSAPGIKGILIYLLVYTFMNLGAFAVITSLRRRNIIGDDLDDIAGLFFKAPTEAVLMLVFLLSLAGIPPLAGFWGKYFIFLSLIQTGHYTLAAVARALRRNRPVLLHEDRQRHVHAAGGGCRAGAHRPGHAPGADHDCSRDGRHRLLPEHLYPRGELVPDQPADFDSATG